MCLHSLITIAVLWVPLVILAAWEGLAVSDNAREAFLYDIATYGRYFVAAPLFVIAASVYLPELAAVVRQVVDAQIVRKNDLPRYEALVGSTRRLLDSPWTSIALLFLAYVSTLTLSRTIYPAGLSTWVAPVTSGNRHLSLAGWWRLLVSQPIFLALLAAWLWRVAVWARFLFGVARMDLRLIGGHPDHLGGLRFVTIPLRGFAILAFAVGAMSASSIAESVIFDGRTAAEFRYLIGGQVAVVLLLFAGPLVLLSRKMFDLKARATFQYGWLASELGRQFELRWLASNQKPTAEALAASDFSATTDLYSIAANVQGINLLVIDLRTAMMLALATLLPYVPLVFALMPFEEVVRLAIKTVL